MTMQKVTERKQELLRRVLSNGYQAGERDVAEAAELVNVYIDELERLEGQISVTRQITDIDKTAARIIARWDKAGVYKP